jgi:hypothetical protein
VWRRRSSTMALSSRCKTRACWRRSCATSGRRQLHGRTVTSACLRTTSTSSTLFAFDLTATHIGGGRLTRSRRTATCLGRVCVTWKQTHYNSSQTRTCDVEAWLRCI